MPQISVSHIDNLDMTQLELIWKELYPKCCENIFLSWNWISNWLTSIPYQYKTVIAKNEQHRIIGLCLLVPNKQRRKILFLSEQLYLHRTGRPEYDQSWIEYNDFLVDAKYTEETKRALIDYILRCMAWEELIVGVSEQHALDSVAQSGLKQKVYSTGNAYQVDLKSLIDNDQTYLSTRSRNTRAQIRKSMRKYEELGKLVIQRAATAEKALKWFKELGPLHIKRWDNIGDGSGFKNPIFVDFHSKFIAGNVETGVVDILRISAGDRVFCYLYNIIQNKEVKFYLSAIQYEHSDNNFKPGFLAHYLAIEYYIKRGFNVYDFMMGDSQYKRSLSTHSSPMSYICFQRNIMKFQIENMLETLKGKYFI